MSAAFLKRPDRSHRLEDDRESAFFVLLWIALRYSESKTHHPDKRNADRTFSPSDDPPYNNVVRLMHAYNEAEVDGRGGVRGGLNKGLWFVCNDLCGLRFSGRPALGALVRELRDESLAVRYECPPTPEDYENLKSLEAEFAEHPNIACLDVFRNALTNSKAYRYPLRLARLTARGWVVDTIRKHLAAADWPRDNATPQQVVPGPETGPRRKIKIYQAPEERAAWR
jgi:hypothetical protein